MCFKIQSMERKKCDSNKRNKAVSQYIKEGTFMKNHKSQYIASRDTGVNQSDISSVCNQKRKSAGGFKWSFVLILFFLSFNIFSQNTSTTKEQQKKIDKFTPEQYIDWSKGLDNETNQTKAIDSLQKNIDAKDILIAKLHKEHKETLTKIVLQNKIAEKSSKEIDSITTDIIKTKSKKRKFDFGAIHLYGGTEIPKFDYNETILNLELMYELGKFDVGIKGTVETVIYEYKKKYEFNYFLRLRYKFF